VHTYACTHLSSCLDKRHAPPPPIHHPSSIILAAHPHARLHARTHQDLPINRLKELFNVNYMIVSQTNPHAIPFIQTEQRPTLHLEASTNRAGVLRKTLRRLTSVVSYLLCSEMMLRCHQLVSLGLAPSIISLLLNQQYVGDVTIVPPLTLEGYSQIISNPSIEALQRFVRVAERRTWPNLEHIRLQCQLEQVLDDCVKHLSLRVQRRLNRNPLHDTSARAVRSARSSRRTPSSGGAAEVDAQGHAGADGENPLSLDAQLTQGAGDSYEYESPHMIGQPRHTHLDLCQFFRVSSGQLGSCGLGHAWGGEDGGEGEGMHGEASLDTLGTAELNRGCINDWVAHGHGCSDGCGAAQRPPQGPPRGEEVVVDKEEGWEGTEARRRSHAWAAKGWEGCGAGRSGGMIIDLTMRKKALSLGFLQEQVPEEEEGREGREGLVLLGGGERRDGLAMLIKSHSCPCTMGSADVSGFGVGCGQGSCLQAGPILEEPMQN
jgi:hypothetical protein